MKTVRRLLGVMLAVGLMVSAMAVFAEDDDWEALRSKEIEEYINKGGCVAEDAPGRLVFYGPMQPNLSSNGYQWFNTNENQWYSCHKGYLSDGKSVFFWAPMKQMEDSHSAVDEAAEQQAAVERALQEQADRDAVRLAGAAMDEGFADVGDMYIANQKNMSAGEFYNNAVVSTPGIDNVVPVGQGGGLIVNGEVTNMSATITKVVNRAYLDYVRVAEEGRVLNVVDVSYPAVEATINFYMPGVTAEDTIVAMQYNAGTWVDIEVAEIRADHVVLNMKGNGVVAFIQK